MIKFTSKGSFDNTEKFLEKMKSKDRYSLLTTYARDGVKALSSATPKDSGISAESWDYSININTRSASITWTNSNVIDGIPVVILLQYGHATSNGVFVEGEYYINPAIRPNFNRISEQVWKAVQSA